jgi:hypothetical protein
MGANAQTSVPLFVANSVLTAAQQNISAATGVPVFATTVTRDAAFGGSNKALAEGQLCYLESTNVVQYYDGAAWATVGPASSGAVVQIKNVFKSDTFSTASTSFVDVTGLSISITPTSASNNILVMVTANLASDGSSYALFARLMRDSTAIAIGDTAGSRIRATAGAYPNGGLSQTAAMNFLDSPATTSATTYKLQIMANASGTIYVNRNSGDSDAATTNRTVSTITVMEVTP